MTTTNPRETVDPDPRGTIEGLPEEHLVETGLRDPADGGRTSAGEGLYRLEVNRDADGRPLAIGADVQSAEVTGRSDAHTDVAGIHGAYPIDRYQPSLWRRDGEGWGVLDDLTEHYWLDPPPGHLVGGPFALLNGPPGKGKSTALRTFAARFLEANGHRIGERVIWRGSPSRDEWLSFAPWTRLLLPANADVSARLKPKRPFDDPLEDVRLSNYVREVVEYETPVDAIKQSRSGGLNVVYPDPTFTGAEDLYRNLPNRRVDEIKQRDELFRAGDPLPHWWIAALLAAVDGGDVSTPVSFVWDEIKEIAKEGAMKDDYGSFQKIHELGGDLAGEMRKNGVTVIGAGHGESAISAEWRNKMHYRLHTAGRAAPVSASGLQGFDETPFYHNVNKGKDAGEGVLFNQENFEELDWPNIQTPLSAFDLKIEVSEP